MDTLLVRSEKVKGYGSFSFWGGFLDFKDTTNLFNYPVKLPKTLSDVLGIRVPIDVDSNLDFIDIIKGQIPSGETVFIVDQNNNQSFIDDTTFSLQPIDWNSSKNAIPVTFLISNGIEITEHQSWIRIGNWNGDIIYGRDEHLSASISIDNESFEVGIIDRRSSDSFTYSLNSEIALFSNKKDLVKISELIKVGEYLKLNEYYYKFDSINNDGSVLRFIKENSFETKIGLQVGMIAPEYKFKSSAGEIVNMSDLHDKPIIIANTCGCGGDKNSTQAYFEMREAYKENAYVLRLDSFNESQLDNWTVNMKDDFNKDSSIKYRLEFCSRVCYVIGKDKRITDKFMITDWEKNLQNILKN